MYGVDDGDMCIVITHMAWVLFVWCIFPHTQVRICEVAFVRRYGHTCGDTYVEMFVSAVAFSMWE